MEQHLTDGVNIKDKICAILGFCDPTTTTTTYVFFFCDMPADVDGTMSMVVSSRWIDNLTDRPIDGLTNGFTDGFME
jgi:hypothetical protein